MTIDPRTLRILSAVSRCGSFTAAASELAMSQPAVSVAIAQLEVRAGLPLVRRDHKGASLTEAGRMLVLRAHAIENILAQAEHELSGHREGRTGPLRIGGTPGALLAVVPMAIKALADAEPSMRVQVVELTDDELVVRLRARAIDLVVCTAAGAPPADDICETALWSEPFRLVTAAATAPPHRSVSVGEAAAFRWVLPLAEGATRRSLEAMFLSAGVALPQHIIRCDSLATMKDLVRQSGFVTLLPDSVVAAEVECGLLQVIPLDGGPPPRTLACWRMEEDDMTPLMQRFLTAALSRLLRP